MKNLTLNVGQRIGLNNVLGQQSGNLAKIAPYWRLMESLRLTEEESAKLQMTTTDGKVGVAWDPTLPSKDVSIEDPDASVVLSLLQSWEHFTPSDLSWLQPIIDGLSK